MQSTNILPQNWKTTLSKVLAQTWIDDSFRQRFVKEPLAILKDAGLVVEDSIKVIVNQGSKSDGSMSVVKNNNISDASDSQESVLYLELPCKPNGLEEEEINFWSKNASQISDIYQPTATC